MKKIFIKLQIGTLALCSLMTSITVLLIIIFLFKEGISFFNKKPIETGFIIAVHPSNSIERLDPDECKKIFDQEITNWDTFTGRNEPITMITLEDIGSYYSEEQIGMEMEYLDTCYNNYIQNNPGIIAVIPTRNYTNNIVARQVAIGDNSLLKFITGKEWFPTAKPVAQFGAFPLLLGTLLVSFGAILFALPLGLACAIFMSEITTPRIRKWMKPLVELLAGIPSVVYGFFGLVVVVPFIQQFFHLDVGETALAGSIILGIMALPTIITISEDAMQNVPNAMREASIAMGATKLQTIFRVVIPYASSGITTAAILGIGRAIGETMAVLMVTGNAANTTLNFLKPVRTIPATIASELGEAPSGGIHYQALFTLACILFLITMSINMYVNFVSRKKRYPQ